MEFWSGARIAAYAARRNLAIKAALAELLGQGVWPLRFQRNYGIIPAAAQIRLLDLPIFIAGCGGLGGHVAAQLCRLGAGRLRLCDCDVFEESNLNRQCFCSEKTLGQPKAEAAAQALVDIAAFGSYEPLIQSITSGNAGPLFADCAIVIDCLDSVAGKKMLERAAGKAAKPFLHGSVLQHEGFAFLATPANGALSRLYSASFAESGAGPVLANVVAGTASLMLALFVRWLAAGAQGSRLLHIDFSIPELEAFQLP
ncbi:MAG: hypothetical protein HDQ44_05195 [Desulfovibrio sp.]|nr:hypothetical protein [Desulfovibrio sp.]